MIEPGRNEMHSTGGGSTIAQSGHMLLPQSTDTYVLKKRCATSVPQEKWGLLFFGRAAKVPKVRPKIPNEAPPEIFLDIFVLECDRQRLPTRF
jgi:hypothetical protein